MLFAKGIALTLPRLHFHYVAKIALVIGMAAPKSLDSVGFFAFSTRAQLAALPLRLFHRHSASAIFFHHVYIWWVLAFVCVNRISM